MNRKDRLLEAVKKMKEHNVSSLAITDDKSSIAGILTERDIVKALANDVPLDGITAGSLMSHPVVMVEKGSLVEDAAKLMVQRKLRHLMVKDTVNGETVGIITATDLVRYLKRNLAKEEIAVSEVWELFF